MAKTAILKVDIISDARKANAGFDQASGKVSAFEKGLAGANRAANIVGAGMIALGVQAVKAASDAEQAAGAVEAVFKGNASAVTKFAENAAQSVGLSQAAYSNFAARIGAQFKNLGTPMDELAGKTNDLISRAADLAATFGGTTADAVDALSAAFRGEFDPIERYGISIRKSDVNARLAAKGLGDLEGAALKAAEAQEIQAMIAEQSADAHGMFTREAETAAGQTQRLTAEWENAKAELGEALLPLLVEAAGHLADLARWVTENKDEVIKWAKILGTAAIAIKGITTAVKLYKIASAGIKTLRALFGLGSTAAMAGQAAAVAGAHATAATGTSAAWATSSTASTTAVGAFAVAAAIEAGVILAAHGVAATGTAAAWGIAAGNMGDSLVEFEGIATPIAENVRASWSGIFEPVASAILWAAWNARALGDAIEAQTVTVLAWVMLWQDGARLAAEAIAGVTSSLGSASLAASLFGLAGGLALAQIAAGLALVYAAGGPVIDMLNNAAIASQIWGSLFTMVAAGIAAGLGTVIGFVNRVIGAVTAALGPTGQLGNVGRAAGAAISGAMGAAAAVINGLAGAAMRVVGALQSVISWARSAASAVANVRFFDGGLLAGAVPPEVAGVAPAGLSFMPPSAVFAASAAGTLGRLGAMTAGRSGAVDARTIINVEGALDPVAVADQIRAVLARTDRTRGVIPAMRLGA